MMRWLQNTKWRQGNGEIKQLGEGFELIQRQGSRELCCGLDNNSDWNYFRLKKQLRLKTTQTQNYGMYLNLSQTTQTEINSNNWQFTYPIMKKIKQTINRSIYKLWLKNNNVMVHLRPKQYWLQQHGHQNLMGYPTLSRWIDKHPFTLYTLFTKLSKILCFNKEQMSRLKTVFGLLLKYSCIIWNECVDLCNGIMFMKKSIRRTCRFFA